MQTVQSENFKQVCVWPSTCVGLEKVEQFKEFMLDNFKARVEYLEEIVTSPDFKNNQPVLGTGGRNDVFFGVHTDDIASFAIPRLQAGIRWIEDVLDNENLDEAPSIYPPRVIAYRTW